MHEADLFTVEHAALSDARVVFDDPAAPGCRAALGELIVHYERLMRETRRLIRRSDRAERDMNHLNRQLQALAEQLEYRASHDQLTGALNRAAVIEHAEACLLRSRMGLIVLDIDLFKRVNDEFGHPVGDAVIQTVVRCLQDLLGDTMPIGRVGGEEFCVILADVPESDTGAIGQSICDAIAAHAFPTPVSRRITASVGVSWCAAGSAFADAYARADEALYAAKRSGRNRVMLAAQALAPMALGSPTDSIDKEAAPWQMISRQTPLPADALRLARNPPAISTAPATSTGSGSPLRPAR